MQWFSLAWPKMKSSTKFVKVLGVKCEDVAFICLFFPTNSQKWLIKPGFLRSFREHGSSVGRAGDSGSREFDPRFRRPLPTGCVGVSIM